MYTQRRAQGSGPLDLVPSRIVPLSGRSLFSRFAALSERQNSPAPRLNTPHPTARTRTTTTESARLHSRRRRQRDSAPANLPPSSVRFRISAARPLCRQIQKLPAQRGCRQNGRPPRAQSRSRRRRTSAPPAEAILGLIRPKPPNGWRGGRAPRRAVDRARPRRRNAARRAERDCAHARSLSSGRICVRQEADRGVEKRVDGLQTRALPSAAVSRLGGRGRAGFSLQY